MKREKFSLKKKLTVVTLIAFVYVLTLSLGYAYFNDSLTINGVASTVDYFEGTALPITPIVLDPENNHYYTADGVNKYLELDGEYWVGDTYHIEFLKKLGILTTRTVRTYNVSFSNPTVLPMTNGTVTTEIIKNFSGGVKETSASISKTELQPGETVTLTFVVTYNFLTRLNDDRVQATVAYDLQGTTRYFHFVIDYYD